MSTRKNKPIRGKIQFESPHYRVYKYQPDILYVSEDAAIPAKLIKAHGVSADPNKFVPYRYRHKFTSEDNDCLRFAESLVTGILQYSEKTCAYSVGGRAFGDTDAKNVQLARKHKQNETANPRVGQAFAIVRTNLKTALKKEDVAPYHIAHVIVEDGDWRITLEANAGDPDLKRPEFGIYSVSIPAKSFHSTYKEIYGEEKAATIVLEKRER